MHLVDRHGLVQRLAAQRALRDPLVVLPDVFAFPADDRRGRWWVFAGRGAWIGLEEWRAARGRRELELVTRAGADARHEQFPYPLRRPLSHGMHAPVPPVPVADDADAAGVG